MIEKVKVGFLTRKRSGALKTCEENIIPLLARDERIDVRVHVLPYSESIGMQMWYLARHFFHLWRIYRESDIVHMYAACNYFIVWNPLLKKLSNKTKTIAAFTHFSLSANIGLMSRLLVWAWRSFDYYIAMSDHSKSQLLSLRASASVRTIYLGAHRKFRPRAQPSFMPYRYILYVGDEYERKNIDTVLSAFAGLRQEFSELVFVKVGRASRRTDAERTDRAVARLGLSDRVVIKRTFVPDEELILYYSNAELLVSPSSLEGFGLPIVEACMCKCLPLLSAIDT